MAGVPIAFSEALNVSQICLHDIMFFGERYCMPKKKRLWGNDRFMLCHLEIEREG